MEAVKERFLKNLYEMKEGGNPKGYKMVADCLEGADPDIIKELEQEGYVELRNEHVGRKYDASHVLTKKGLTHLFG